MAIKRTFKIQAGSGGLTGLARKVGQISRGEYPNQEWGATQHGDKGGGVQSVTFDSTIIFANNVELTVDNS